MKEDTHRRVLRAEESSTLGVGGVRTQDGEWPVAVYGGNSLPHEETDFEKFEWKDPNRFSVPSQCENTCADPMAPNNLLYPQPCSQEKLLDSRFLFPGVVRASGKQETADRHNEQRFCVESWLLRSIPSSWCMWTWILLALPGPSRSLVQVSSMAMQPLQELDFGTLESIKVFPLANISAGLAGFGQERGLIFSYCWYASNGRRLDPRGKTCTQHSRLQPSSCHPLTSHLAIM